MEKNQHEKIPGYHFQNNVMGLIGAAVLIGTKSRDVMEVCILPKQLQLGNFG